MGKFLAILPIVFLSGCAVPVMVSMGVGAASVAVNESTGKTMSDHVVSSLNGRDCKISRVDKEDICQDNYGIQIKITNTSVTPSTVKEIESKYH